MVASAARRLSWNPYRTDATPRSAGVPVTADRWWSWNPYRRERQGERLGERVGFNKGRSAENRIMTRQIRRGGHPVIGAVVFLAALAGAGFLGLAYETGSFSAGGAVVDHRIAAWRSDLLTPVSTAGARSGQALQDAGKTISAKSQQLSKPGG
jgi:hypothetical protein